MSETLKEDENVKVEGEHCVFHKDVLMVPIVNRSIPHRRTLVSKMCPTCGWVALFESNMGRVKTIHIQGRTVKEEVQFL